MSPNEGQLPARAVECRGEQIDQGLVRSGVDRWGGDPNAERAVLFALDRILGGSRLQPDGQVGGVALDAEPSREFGLGGYGLGSRLGSWGFHRRVRSVRPEPRLTWGGRFVQICGASQILA
jgi:hypothetical protein